jgi:hypothetical protein
MTQFCLFYFIAPWFDYYLRDRKPIAINSNPFMAFAMDPDPQYYDQVGCCGVVSCDYAFAVGTRHKHGRIDCTIQALIGRPAFASRSVSYESEEK